MPHARILIASLAFALLGAPAFAADEPPTATATGQSSVADQIDAYLRSSPVANIPDDGTPDGVVALDTDRRVHGEVSVGIGTNGYRSVYMRSDMPVGETGAVSVAIADTRFNGRSGLGGGYRAAAAWASAWRSGTRRQTAGGATWNR